MKFFLGLNNSVKWNVIFSISIFLASPGCYGETRERIQTFIFLFNKLNVENKIKRIQIPTDLDPSTLFNPVSV